MKRGVAAGRCALVLGLLLGAARCGPPPALAPDPATPRPAPRGYIALCTKDPGFCEGGGAKSVALTAPRWAELLRVNDGVNTLLKAREDPLASESVASWDVPSGALQAAEPADCKEYVLAKKEKLVELGWPKSALRIGIVTYSRHTPRLRHAVLLADTSEGLFVLDNLERKVLPWTDAPYSWVALQVSTDPDRWEAVHRETRR